MGEFRKIVCSDRVLSLSVLCHVDNNLILAEKLGRSYDEQNWVWILRDCYSYIISHIIGTFYPERDHLNVYWRLVIYNNLHRGKIFLYLSWDSRYNCLRLGWYLPVLLFFYWKNSERILHSRRRVTLRRILVTNNSDSALKLDHSTLDRNRYYQTLCDRHHTDRKKYRYVLSHSFLLHSVLLPFLDAD